MALPEPQRAVPPASSAAPAGAVRMGERLAAVRAEIALSARRAGRPASAVTLVAVTKSAPAEVFPWLAAAGVTEVGESRVQAAQARRAGGANGLRWHLVGHLQANKARRALALFDVLHGVDSLELLARLEAVAADAAADLADRGRNSSSPQPAPCARMPELLLQVNVSGEPAKHGLHPEALPAALDLAATLRHVRVTGLMTMAPESDDPEASRPHFRALADLRDRCARPSAGLPLRELSMGMSGDFAVAVEAGATLVRVGRRLFDDLGALAAPPHPPLRSESTR